jgi:hypothetical protein
MLNAMLASLPCTVSAHLAGPGASMIQFCMASLLATMVLDDDAMELIRERGEVGGLMGGWTPGSGVPGVPAQGHAGVMGTTSFAA